MHVLKPGPNHLVELVRPGSTQWHAYVNHYIVFIKFWPVSTIILAKNKFCLIIYYSNFYLN